MINLEGKRILVTGASSGIGKAFSEQAASLGASLILWGRNPERLAETFNSLEGSGHEYHAFDMTDYALAEQHIIKAVADGRKINGFVHSAGIEKTTPSRLQHPRFLRKCLKSMFLQPLKLPGYFPGKA